MSTVSSIINFETTCSTTKGIVIKGGVLNFINNATMNTISYIQTSNIAYLNMFDTSTLFIKDTGYIRLNLDCVMNMYNNSRVFADDHIYVTSGTFNMFDNSVIEKCFFIPISEGGVFTMRNNSIIKNIFNLLSLGGDSSQFNILDNARVQSSGNFSSTGGTFTIKSENIQEKFIINQFKLDYTVLDIDKNSYITAKSVVLTSTSQIKLNGRTIRDPPLFFTNDISDNSNIFDQTEPFDLAVTNIPFVSTISTSFTTYFENRLMRFGSSNKFFCHLKGENIESGNFLEPFCPCYEELCFIVPSGNNAVLNLKIDSVKNVNRQVNNLKVLNKKETEEENIVTIGSNKISLYSFTDIVINIISDEFVAVSFFKLTKSVLLISQNADYVFDTTSCNLGYYNSTSFQCLTKIECTKGGLNKITRQCESCTKSNCEICTVYNGDCMKCSSGYYGVNGECILIENCQLTMRDFCVICKLGYTYYNGKCVTSQDHCSIRETEESCLFCDRNSNTKLSNGKCVSIGNNVILFSHNSINACENGYYTENGEICQKCTDKHPNSVSCNFKYATRCSLKFEMSDLGACDTSSCEVAENTIKDANGKCEKPTQNCVYKVNTKCVECESKTILNSQKECKTLDDSNCEIQNSFGCLRCVSGKYFDTAENSCEKCNSTCSTCISSPNFCQSCSSEYYLNNYSCVSQDDLLATCLKFSYDSLKCLQCDDGFYLINFVCNKCPTECSTCNSAGKCLSCNSSNFMTNENKCVSKDSIVGCDVEITEKGCSTCQDGYFQIKSNQCEKCSDLCVKCESKNACEICVDNYVLSEKNCSHYTLLKYCLEAHNSKCSKCEFWKAPSQSGTFCVSKAVWWVIFIIVIFVIVLVIIIFICVVILFVVIHKKLRKSEIESKMTIFKMQNSNLKFNELKGGVCVDQPEIDFNNEDDEIPVSEETRKLICVGNTNNQTVKIQFVAKTFVEKFNITVKPSIATLHKNCACEFEFFITPNYTCKIEDNIVLVSKNIETGEEILNELVMKGVTTITTKLDPNEIVFDNKLGEGSFGVVYKGTYRNNTVAIKKIKSVDLSDEIIEEFEKEVNMLDKFRSDYIVHFYGAVFIPNKVCMVTEFAQYGSLQDLIKHKKSEDIDIKLRVKMMIDAAKGILYLHENGILHRDIKPDNILVISLNVDDKVIAKLTDFGSARNVNLLMTNMTFTKGIGTPVYMAPEILSQEKYKKPADIYSFGITMFEGIGWCDAYPKGLFAFPWKIAEYVNNGKRPEKKDDMDDKIFSIVDKCWVHNPIKRLDIKEVIKQLDNL
ncbi:protein serine/threonine kinase, putative [Entamoeba invadens IP1]|uniref:Protein serine/threonine kinase, putative n=1 Tax=Entamoeba invadens IP1 TaxID=370355 RepID=A0A0A1UB12_ENTIV|nr:protein serine/threonine kinase, putative [Entamoeba invadens IP1]ELP92347.1 protein serine/threonine kinase, putative [Entamoeba invadens IP1]|eukprot:XP_004259118.1 protein serine/threonine kinase, putative [Entamoeba invadens IP1]